MVESAAAPRTFRTLMSGVSNDSLPSLDYPIDYVWAMVKRCIEPNMSAGTLLTRVNPCIDASKVPPSRFQQRKGSIYSTQGSRDGHVQKNNERDKDFHEKHHKLFGKVKEKAKEVTGASHRRKSSSGSKTD